MNIITALFGSLCYHNLQAVATCSSWCFLCKLTLTFLLFWHWLSLFSVYSNLIGFLVSSILGDLGDLGSLKLGLLMISVSSFILFVIAVAALSRFGDLSGNVCHLKGKKIKFPYAFIDVQLKRMNDSHVAEDWSRRFSPSSTSLVMSLRISSIFDRLSCFLFSVELSGLLILSP